MADSDSPWKAPFFTLWTGQAVSLFGSSLVQFALVWWLTQSSGSATVLAGATLAAMLPQILLGPVAGVLVDRGSRRRIMLVSDSLVALTTLALAVLFALDRTQIWHVYLAMFLRSLGGAFHFAAMQASTSLMVPRQQLARVSGLNQMLNGGMNIVAPPLGALLLSLLPLQGILAIDVATAVAGVAPLLFIAVPQPTARAAAAGAPAESFWGQLAAGVRYIARWPGLTIILCMAVLLNFLLSPAGALLPIVVTQHFRGGPLELAWLESAFGLGVVAGGLLLSLWGGFKRRVVTSMAGLIGLGVGFGLIGLTPASALWLAVLAALLAAVMQAFTNGPLMATLQAVVAPEMQGRVFTLVGSAATAMAPLGLLIAGPLSDRMGVLTWYVIGGLACVLMGLLGFSLPAVMNMESQTAASLAPAAARADLVL